MGGGGVGGSAQVVVGDGEDFEIEMLGGLVVGEHVFAEVGEEDALGVKAAGGEGEAIADLLELEDAFEGFGGEEMLFVVALGGPALKALGGALEEGFFVGAVLGVG